MHSRRVFFSATVTWTVTRCRHSGNIFRCFCNVFILSNLIYSCYKFIINVERLFLINLLYINPPRIYTSNTISIAGKIVGGLFTVKLKFKLFLSRTTQVTYVRYAGARAFFNFNFYCNKSTNYLESDKKASFKSLNWVLRRVFSITIDSYWLLPFCLDSYKIKNATQTLNLKPLVPLVYGWIIDRQAVVCHHVTY